MCKAFSCVIERTGKVHWKFGMDSHSDIVEMSGLADLEADRSKLQFARVEITPRNDDYRHPDEWTLTVDEQAKPRWWSPTHEVKCRRAHEQWCEQFYEILDRDTVIRHPFRDITPPAKITQEHIDLLHQWRNVWDSICSGVWVSIEGSVWSSVWASVEGSVWASVGDSVWSSVRDHVWRSIGASVRNSIGGSVTDHVWSSVGTSVGAQIGSLFRIERSSWKYTESLPQTPKYPFQAAVDLWNLGLVPSFDGKTWRLHGGPDGCVMHEEGICR